MATEVIDMEIPPSVKMRMFEQQKMIENFEKAQKIREQYPTLRKRLEAIRESRPIQQTTYKEQSAYEHFEFLRKQQEEQLAQLEANFEKVKAQYELGRQNILRKSLYVEEKLQKAKDRLENKTEIKTKEEILLEKSIVELIQKHIELQPNWDLAQCFPNYKELNITLPTSSVIKDEPVEQPKPSLPKAKRKAKQVTDDPPLVIEQPEEKKEEPPLPQAEPEPEPEPRLTKADQRFGKLITNTKIAKPRG